MRMSKRLVCEKAFVQGFLGKDVICDSCGATLETYASSCQADLSSACPGFIAIEKAKSVFDVAYKKEGA